MKTSILNITVLLIFISSNAIAQQKRGTIKGTIKTNTNAPAEMISVALKGTSYGTMSNEKGGYELNNIPAGNYWLFFTFIGMETDSVSIKVNPDKITNVPTITMRESQTNLAVVNVEAKREKHYIETVPSQSLRINTPLIETPQNISVATQQTMKDFGITGTAQMSRLTSGIVKRYGGDNDFSFIIRGTDATNNIFRNGVGSYWYNQQSDAFMIERVEFVKGPAGFMIGNSEPGGLVNEVTKQPDGFKIREVMLGYGSYNLMRAGLDLGGKFSSASKFSYRLVGGGAIY